MGIPLWSVYTLDIPRNWPQQPKPQTAAKSSLENYIMQKMVIFREPPPPSPKSLHTLKITLNFRILLTVLDPSDWRISFQTSD